MNPGLRLDIWVRSRRYSGRGVGFCENSSIGKGQVPATPDGGSIGLSAVDAVLRIGEGDR
jgi:hypothetical protein